MVNWRACNIAGPCHADELNYLFNMDLGIDLDCKPEEEMINSMCIYWSNFAKHRWVGMLETGSISRRWLIEHSAISAHRRRRNRTRNTFGNRRALQNRRICWSIPKWRWFAVILTKIEWIFGTKWKRSWNRRKIRSARNCKLKKLTFISLWRWNCYQVGYVSNSRLFNFDAFIFGSVIRWKYGVYICYVLGLIDFFLLPILHIFQSLKNSTSLRLLLFALK